VVWSRVEAFISAYFTIVARLLSCRFSVLYWVYIPAAGLSSLRRYFTTAAGLTGIPAFITATVRNSLGKRPGFFRNIHIIPAMSIGTANASMPDSATTESVESNAIIAISSPDLRVAVYDGIATLVGTAETHEEAQAAEQEIRQIAGIEHVINMITWG